MYSKSLTLKHSLALSFASTLFSMGYILHDRMESSITSLLTPYSTAIHPTASQKEEWDREMMVGWWPPQ